MSQRFKSIRGCKPYKQPQPMSGTFGRIGGSRGFRKQPSDLRVSWGKEKGHVCDRIHVTISESVANRYGFVQGMPVSLTYHYLDSGPGIVFILRCVSESEGVRLCNLSAGNKMAGLRTTFRVEREGAAGLFRDLTSFSCEVLEDDDPEAPWPAGYCEFACELKEKTWALA